MVLIIALVIAVAVAGPVTEFALKRDASPSERVRFTLALRQRNVHALKDLVTGTTSRSKLLQELFFDFPFFSLRAQHPH